MKLFYRGLVMRTFLPAFAALIAAAGAARAGEDKVTLVKNKEVISGRVKKDDINEVQVEIRDPKSPEPIVRTFNAQEVADIEWDVGDPDFREAITEFKRGSYNRAADTFLSFTTPRENAEKFRAEARPYLFYIAAESLYQAGKAAPAVEAFEKFINEFKNSRYVPAAIGDMVDVAIQNKTFDKIPGWLNQLRGLGTEQRLLADYFTGKMLAAQGKSKEAESKYAAAASSAVPQTKALGLLGQARCALASNNAAAARQSAQQALAADSSAPVAGTAHLLLGDAILADAKNLAGDALQDALLDAILEYLRVQLQYGGDPRTEPQAYLKTGECFQRLSKFTTRASSDDRERAIAMYSKLLADPRYRNSEFALKASENLKELR